jgi:predicted dehydrogenase
VEFPLPYVRWTEQRNLAAVIELLACGKVSVDHLTTHRFTLADVTAAYELVGKDRTALGIVIDYPSVVGSSDANSIERVQRTISRDSPALPRAGRSAPAIGMLGAGGFGARFLIPQLKAAGAGLHRIASSGGVNAAHCARKFGFAHATTDASSIFEDPAIDAVVIATRHDSHARYVIEGLRHGKAVFVEKPLCLTPAELDEIEQAYRAATSPFVMVGYNRRFAPLVTEVKRLLERVSAPKAIILTINAGVLPADHWHHDPRQGGGRLLAEGCHFVDLLMFLAGSCLERVEAIQTTPTDGDRERPDAITVTLRFANGTVGTMHYLGNGPASFPKERIEVFAAGRALQIDNFRRLRGYQWPGLRGGRQWRQDKGHSAELKAFVTALADGKPSPIAFDDIVTGMKICFEAAARAR